MKIQCQIIQDFLDNLRDADVFQKRVYVNKSYQPLNGDNPRNATSFEIFFQASAVLQFEEGGEALLECGQSCGINRLSQPGTYEGSTTYTKRCNELSVFCNEHDLKIMPGVLGF